MKTLLVAALMLLVLLSGEETHGEPLPEQDLAELDLETLMKLEVQVTTARKREENVQDTPISISMLNDALLDLRGITRLDQIASSTPNLVLQNHPSFGASTMAAAIYIRGIGQKDFVPTVDPGVGLYVDGVYRARTVDANLDLLDIERIEVLRGPQGTLFGRNTIGGAISITSIEPDEILRSRLSATVGSGNRRELRGSLNVPFSDRFYGRLALLSIRRDGVLRRLEDGRELGEDDRFAARGALRWKGAGGFEAQWAFDGARARESSAVELLGIDYASPAFAATGVPTDNLALLHNFLATVLPPQLGGGHNCLSNGGAGDPTDAACFNEAQYLLGRGVTAGTAPTSAAMDSWGTNLRLDGARGALAFKSITAYRELDGFFERDTDQSPLAIAQVSDRFDQWQFTQELQVLGTSFDRRLQWIVGAYYFEEEGANANHVDFVPIELLSGGLFGGQSKALFSQGTYALTERFSITAGLRVTRDRKTFLPQQIILTNRTGNPGFDPGVRPLPPVEAERSFSQSSPLLNVAYRWVPGRMIYASVSEGFKSGGFVQRVFPPLLAVPSFKPELTQVYEVGAKISSAEDRFRLNAAVFRTDYEDLQIQAFTSIAPVTQNAAAARILGAELELQALAGANWLIAAGAGYLDPEYLEVSPQATQISTAQTFESIPRWNLHASLSPSFTLGTRGSLMPRVDWSYRSKFFNDSQNTPALAQPAYHLVNASVLWSSSGYSWGVTLGVSNLTNERYLQSAILASGIGEALYARQREWYCRARRDF